MERKARVNFKFKPYRIVPLARIVLCKIYVAHVNDEPRQSLTVEDIARLFSIPMSQNLLKTAVEHLRGNSYNDPKLVTRHSAAKDKPKNHASSITEAGIVLVERSLRRRDSDLTYFMQHGDEALDDIAGLNSIFMTDAERLDSDPWIPLPIDRESSDYKETVEEIEKAIETIRQDNGYAANEPEERNSILETLETGVRWLKERLPTKAQMTSLLATPLRWVATKFPDTIIGEAAKRAAQKLLDYISGLLF